MFTDFNGMKVGYAFCASFCTLERSFLQMKELVEKGADVYPIMSERTYNTDSRFTNAEEFRTSKRLSRFVVTSLSNPPVISAITAKMEELRVGNHGRPLLTGRAAGHTMLSDQVFEKEVYPDEKGPCAGYRTAPAGLLRRARGDFRKGNPVPGHPVGKLL